MWVWRWGAGTTARDELKWMRCGRGRWNSRRREPCPGAQSLAWRLVVTADPADRTQGSSGGSRNRGGDSQDQVIATYWEPSWGRVCKQAKSHTATREHQQWGDSRNDLSPNTAIAEPHSVQFSSVHSLSPVRLFVTPWTAARQASLSITNSWSPPKPMSIESVMPSNHLVLCRPLLLLPSIFPSIRSSNESVLRIRWPKYWSFSFNISPSSEHPGLISFRMDWMDLLEVQGTLKSLLQHHSSKASILQLSAFFIVQLSHPYMTTGKTIALTRQTFVGKVMSLLFNMLSREPH